MKLGCIYFITCNNFSATNITKFLSESHKNNTKVIYEKFYKIGNLWTALQESITLNLNVHDLVSWSLCNFHVGPVFKIWMEKLKSAYVWLANAVKWWRWENDLRNEHRDFACILMNITTAPLFEFVGIYKRELNNVICIFISFFLNKNVYWNRVGCKRGFCSWCCSVYWTLSNDMFLTWGNITMLLCEPYVFILFFKLFQNHEIFLNFIYSSFFSSFGTRTSMNET